MNHPGVVSHGEALQTVLGEAIARLEREAEKHKRLHRRGQTAIIALSAATTVAAGAAVAVPADSKAGVELVVLVLSALATAITSWLEMRKARELWQHEKDIYYQLFDIQRELRYRTASAPLTEAQADSYFADVTRILRSSSESWMRLTAPKKPEA